jgi:hypothetical protein
MPCEGGRLHNIHTMQGGWFIIVAVAVGAGAAAGCAFTTMKEVVAEKERGGGTSKTYLVAADLAFDISREILRSQGGDAIEEHRAEGFMLTSSGGDRFTRGTLMGVWIAPAGAQTRVTVVTKRRLPTNAVTTLTEGGFHEIFAQMLAGKQLVERSRQADNK